MTEMTEAAIISDYVREAYRPSFNKFINKNYEKVMNASVNIVTENAVDLQYHWMREYNIISRSTRPKSKVYSRPEVASKAFSRIFERCANLYTINNGIESSSMSAAESHTLRSISLLEASSSSTPATESHTLRSISLLEASSSSTPATESFSITTLAQNLSIQLGSNVPSEIQRDFRKLTDSCCINMMRPDLISIYQDIMRPDTYEHLISTCQSRKEAFEATDIDVGSLNLVFDKLASYRYGQNKNRILASLDQQEYEEKDKESSLYWILCMVESIIKAFHVYADETNISESTYLRKFEAILDNAFDGTDLKLKDGETISKSSLRNQIFNDYDVNFGRKIDLMITNGTSDKLCSIEFKKADTTTKVLQHQQSKNLRINGCLLNEMHLLTHNQDIGICYMDFAGRHGYIAEVFRHQDFFAAYKVAPVHVAKSMFELDEMKRCIANLLRWKVQVLHNQYQVIEATIREETKYSQVEYSRDLIRLSTPEQRIPPIDIVFTPPKGR